MFRRRTPHSTLSRLRNFMWPRTGWVRSTRYVGHRLGRLPGSPYSIAAGVAIGAAVSFTPFIGFHILLTLLLCFLVRANVLAGTIGTAVGNPWTFPVIWLWIYNLGLWILDVDPVVAPNGFKMGALWDFVVAGLNYIGKGVIFGVWDAELSINLSHHWASMVSVMWPMTVGGLPTAVAVGLVIYVPLRRGVAAYQHNRLVRRMTKRHHRLFAPKGTEEHSHD